MKKGIEAFLMTYANSVREEVEAMEADGRMAEYTFQGMLMLLAGAWCQLVAKRHRTKFRAAVAKAATELRSDVMYQFERRPDDPRAREIARLLGEMIIASAAGSGTVKKPH